MTYIYIYIYNRLDTLIYINFQVASIGHIQKSILLHTVNKYKLHHDVTNLSVNKAVCYQVTKQFINILF